jgi:hypothetical protein
VKEKELGVQVVGAWVSRLYRVQGSGYRGHHYKFGVQGSGYRGHRYKFGAQGSESMIWGARCRVWSVDVKV